MLHWDKARRELQSWDGRETAPAAATEAYFLTPDGKPMNFFDAVIGGQSVGVPGVVAMLEAAHKEHGALPWHKLFDPAIRLAEQGFIISERLHILFEQMPKVAVNPQISDYFFVKTGVRLEA